MRKKLIMLSIIFALAAGVSSYFFLESLKVQSRQNTDLVRVLVAAKELAAYRPVEQASVVFRQVPQNELLPGAVKDIAQLEEAVTKMRIYPGEQIIKEKIFYTSESVAGLSFRVHPEKRAVTLGVNDVQGLAGLAKPEDRVDVMATIDPPSDPNLPNKGPKTVVVVENVRLLAVNQFLDRQAEGAQMATVTLEMTPREAQAAVLAANMGQLHLSLRHFDNNKKNGLVPIGVDYLLRGGE